MTAEEQCIPDPESLDREELIQLVNALHEAHHEALDTQGILVNSISSMAYAYHVLADQVGIHNKFGKRRFAMAMLQVKLESLYQIGLSSIGVTPEDVTQAEQFADIVEDLANDPTFGRTPPEPPTEEAT